MTTKPNLQKIGTGAGLITASCFIMYFTFMKYFNLLQVLELRALNFFILLAGIVAALNKYKKQNDNHIEYFEGLGLGVITTVFAVAIFAVFTGIYLSINTDFMSYIKSNAMMGSYLDPSSCSLVILIEGMASGVIISFTCMQYYRKFSLGHN